MSNLEIHQYSMSKCGGYNEMPNLVPLLCLVVTNFVANPICDVEECLVVRIWQKSLQWRTG